MNRRVISSALTLAVLLAGVGAAYSVASSFTGTSRADDPGVPVADPTPTPAIPPDNDLNRARIEVTKVSPVIGVIVAAVEQGDVDALARLSRFELRECTPKHARTGYTPRCEALGLLDGSLVEVFPEDVGFGVLWFHDRGSLMARLSQLLVAASPRIELIATKDGDELLLSFAIDETPDGLNWVLFGVGSSDNAPIRYIVPGATATTVFDYIRFEEETGGHRFDVLGTSSELIERAQALHDRDERCSKVPLGEDPPECR